MLSLTAGALVASGFNMGAVLAPPERRAGVAGLVMVMIAIGSVVLNFVGAAVLQSNQVRVGVESVSSARGVATYISIGIGAFLLAGVVALLLVRRQRGTPGDA